MTLLEYIKDSLHAQYEKNMAYERSGDTDEFVSELINEMSNCELIEYIDQWMARDK